ncbi:MAG: serine hydrolase [Acidobacteria bacterium]|nr:serine hydrolase [Acidobacteriota bacterium]
MLAGALLTVGCLQPGQETTGGSPFIADRLQRLDTAIQRSIDEGEIPGAVVLITHDGETAYHRAFGYRDIEQQSPMTKETIFRIASMTKAITSVGVMILYERGHFLLTDPISNYLPEFKNPKVLVKAGDDGQVLETRDATREITIIDLLTHTSGISYPFIERAVQSVYKTAGLIDGVTARTVRLHDQMQILAQQPLLHDPGEKFTYGLSTDLLGYFCEVASGKPFDRFLDDEIFTPLEMNDTYFYLPEEKASRLATLYAVDEDGNLKVSQGDESDIYLDNPLYPVEGAKTYFSGGGGLSSTARDYARFLQMLLNEGDLDGKRILSRKSVEFLISPRVSFTETGPPKMSAAFYVNGTPGEEGGLASVGAYSWGGAFTTTYFIDPREDLIGVFMSQGRPLDSSIQNKFKVLVYQALR